MPLLTVRLTGSTCRCSYCNGSPSPQVKIKPPVSSRIVSISMSLGKKRKATASPTENGSSVDELYQETESLTSKLWSALDELEQSDSTQSRSVIENTSLHMLQLKSLQRRLLDEIHTSQAKLVEQRKVRDRQELELENLRYQKVLNNHAIEASRNPDISNLTLLCRSELEGDADPTTGDKELIQRFFQADAHDPNQRGAIVDKLNQQLERRKGLETELGILQREASALKQSLNEKRKTLESLPSKLQDIERACVPLRKFCKASLHTSRASDPERLGTMELAHSLPKALYTLFYLLQSALHGMEASGEMSIFEKYSMVPSVEVQTDPSPRVLLLIPIPTISDPPMGSVSSGSGFGGGRKPISIDFEFDQASNTVSASCSGDDQITSKLLIEVFPGDRGDEPAKQSNSDESSNSYRISNGRPYSWCNYLAGLHLPRTDVASTPQPYTSASAIIRTLVERVRAEVTLSWILNALSRKQHPLPVHPNMKDASFSQRKDSHTRLVSWSEDLEASDSSTAFFLATLTCRSSTLNLRVGISKGRYPVTPPIWKINTGQEGRGGKLDEGEKALVNENLEVKLKESLEQDVEKLVDTDDATTHDWVLSHKLSEVARKWEELLLDQSE